MRLNFFDKYMRFYQLLGWPAMTVVERRAYQNLLLALARRGPLRIFEYGSGFSTVYFGRFLRRQGADFQFYSVDNNLFWHEKVKNMVGRGGLKNRVNLSIFSFPPFWDRPGWRWDSAPGRGQFAPCSREEENYIQQPLTLGGGFDLIVVDGRFRRRCLSVAAQALKPNGIVLVHDAQKPHYGLAQSSFAHSRWIEGGKFYPWEKNTHRMWAGSNQPLAI